MYLSSCLLLLHVGDTLILENKKEFTGYKFSISRWVGQRKRFELRRSDRWYFFQNLSCKLYRFDLRKYLHAFKTQIYQNFKVFLLYFIQFLTTISLKSYFIVRRQLLFLYRHGWHYSYTTSHTVLSPTDRQTQ